MRFVFLSLEAEERHEKVFTSRKKRASQCEHAGLDAHSEACDEEQVRVATVENERDRGLEEERRAEDGRRGRGRGRERARER